MNPPFQSILKGDNPQAKVINEETKLTTEGNLRIRRWSMCLGLIALIFVAGLLLGKEISHLVESAERCSDNMTTKHPNIAQLQGGNHTPLNCSTRIAIFKTKNVSAPEKEQTFYGAHLYLNQVSGSNELKWQLPDELDAYSYITGGLELKGNSLMLIPLSGIYRVYSHLSFETRHSGYTCITHYIKSMTSLNSSHEVLLKTRQSVGHLCHKYKERGMCFLASGIDGSVKLRKGLFVGVYVTEGAKKWISPSRKSNYFGIQLISHLD